MKHGIIGLALLIASATAGAGALIHVANNGLDAPGCGTAASPCRSITAGIAAAAEGDTVVVRPGLYGDLDMDGALGSQGEETGDVAGVVAVNKRVTIISSGGPAVTSIRGINGRDVVKINANGAQFGAKDAGFTLYGGNIWGIETAALARGKVAGNVVRGVGSAMAIVSSDLWDVSDNYITEIAGQGIVILSANDGTGATNVHDNIVIGGEFNVGIQLSPRAAHRVSNNVVNGPYYGIIVSPGQARISGNTLTNNRIGIAYSNYVGTQPAGGTPVITRNSIIGNRGSGIFLLPAANFPLTLRENNIFGNGVCGIAANGNVAVDARNNYWGAATGPSFTDPADSVCDPTNTSVQTTPFSTREFQIK